jgi:rare lipoprotein A
MALAGLWLAQPAPAEAAISAQCGGASWYALDGRRTASGEVMNSSRLTAAHRYLPLGSVVTLHNRRNGRAVTVRINDRGPFIGGRIIDVSRAAAYRLGMIGAGVASVCLSRGTAYASNDDGQGGGRKSAHRHSRSGKYASRSGSHRRHMAAAERRHASHRRHVAALEAKRRAHGRHVTAAKTTHQASRSAGLAGINKAAGNGGKTTRAKDAAAGMRNHPNKQVKRNQGGRRSPDEA